MLVDSSFDAQSRTPAWGGLGTTFARNQRTSASRAIARAGLDFRLDLEPLPVTIGADVVDSGRVAVTRTHPPRVLGVVGKNYRLLQATALGRLLDPLAGVWPVENAGMLRDGRVIFLVLDAGATEVGGDEVRNYFMVVDDRGGGGGLTFAYTPVRIACGNAIVAGVREASFALSLRHSRGMADRARAFIGLQQRLVGVREQVLQNLRVLVQTQLDAAGVTHVLETAYPLPPEPDAALRVQDPKRLAHATRRYEYERDRQLGLRESVQHSYERFNSEQPHTAGSAWAVFNAVSEVEDHLRPGPARIRQRSAIFGAGAVTKRRAFQAALDLA
jgi:hypothetical protein